MTESMKEDDTAVITSVLTDYYRVFSTLDAQAISGYFHEPSLIVSPLGVVAAATRADHARAFAATGEGLRARGYGRSELTMLRVTRLSATTACASGVAVRYKTDGLQLERVGVTYVLNKAASDWKIAVLVTHDPDHVLRAE
jgi:ketosteroid isomerase-like protein